MSGIDFQDPDVLDFFMQKPARMRSLPSSDRNIIVSATSAKNDATPKAATPKVESRPPPSKLLREVEDSAHVTAAAPEVDKKETKPPESDSTITDNGQQPDVARPQDDPEANVKLVKPPQLQTIHSTDEANFVGEERSTSVAHVPTALKEKNGGAAVRPQARRELRPSSARISRVKNDAEFTRPAARFPPDPSAIPQSEEMVPSVTRANINARTTGTVQSRPFKKAASTTQAAATVARNLRKETTMADEANASRPTSSATRKDALASPKVAAMQAVPRLDLKRDSDDDEPKALQRVDEPKMTTEKLATEETVVSKPTEKSVADSTGGKSTAEPPAAEIEEEITEHDDHTMQSSGKESAQAQPPMDSLREANEMLRERLRKASQNLDRLYAEKQQIVLQCEAEKQQLVEEFEERLQKLQDENVALKEEIASKKSNSDSSNTSAVSPPLQDAPSLAEENEFLKKQNENLLYALNQIHLYQTHGPPHIPHGQMPAPEVIPGHVATQYSGQFAHENAKDSRRDLSEQLATANAKIMTLEGTIKGFRMALQSFGSPHPAAMMISEPDPVDAENSILEDTGSLEEDRSSNEEDIEKTFWSAPVRRQLAQKPTAAAMPPSSPQVAAVLPMRSSNAPKKVSAAAASSLKRPAGANISSAAATRNTRQAQPAVHPARGSSASRSAAQDRRQRSSSVGRPPPRKTMEPGDMSSNNSRYDVNENKKLDAMSLSSSVGELLSIGRKPIVGSSAAESIIRSTGSGLIKPTNGHEDIRLPFAPTRPDEVRPGFGVKFVRANGRLAQGNVRYVGVLPDKEEISYGVELESRDGNHDGTYQGKRYFQCPAQRGLFVPFSRIIAAWKL